MDGFCRTLINAWERMRNIESKTVSVSATDEQSKNEQGQPMSAATAARIAGALACLALCVATGCNRLPADATKEAPPAVSVQPDADPALVEVTNPAAFPLVTAAGYEAPAKLDVTGTVTPDVSRTIPVISIAAGRVVAIHARLGDTVKKGQLLMEVQSNDVATAFNTYLKAVSDERLTQIQLNRARLLLDKGAIPTVLYPQMGTDWSPVGKIYWYTLRSTNPAYDSMELKSLEDWKLEKEFKSVPGVVDVSSFGGITREYQVRLDPDKLIAYGLSIAQV
jgi:biotin carboxyl carrier protein